MYDLIIHDCHVLTPTGDIRRNCDLVIDEGKITDILPTGQADLGQAHELLEGRQMLAMPGLINTHAHTPMVIFYGLAEDVPIERWFNEFMWPTSSWLI